MRDIHSYAAGEWLAPGAGARNIASAITGEVIAQAGNVLVFSAAGLGDGSVPIIADSAEALPEGHPDPLAQALVLTAIVISFGVLAFCITLLKKTRSRSGGSDINYLKGVDS